MKNNQSSSIPIKPTFHNKKRVKKVYNKRAYYLFITVILMICLFQAARGVYLNIAKYITLNKQYDKLEYLNNTAQQKNLKLKTELKNYTSHKGIEALARDNLQMVGQDEVLVVIKDPPALNTKESKKK